MSEAVSALKGTSFDGFARVEETGLQGMITVRGDLASAEMAAALQATVGTAVPETRKVVFGKSGAVAWMSPDELLVVVAHHAANDVVANLVQALDGQHALVVNVSDARATFRISGPAARDVLAKLAPVDLAPEVFGAGDIRRTRLAQVPGAFWLNEDNSFDVVCFRSVAQYVFDILKLSATPGGEVGLLT